MASSRIPKDLGSLDPEKPASKRAPIASNRAPTACNLLPNPRVPAMTRDHGDRRAQRATPPPSRFIPLHPKSSQIGVRVDHVGTDWRRVQRLPFVFLRVLCG